MEKPFSLLCIKNMAVKKSSAKTTKEVVETAKNAKAITPSSEKLAKLQELKASLQKKYSDAFVTEEDAKVEYYSTSSLALDSILGNKDSLGGFPQGRVVEVYWPEGAGKTTIALLAMAEEIRNGGTVLFVDAENAFDPYRASTLGIPVNNEDQFVLLQTGIAEEAFEVMEEYIRSGLCSMIVLDSVAALTPRTIIENGYSDSNMGVKARFMSQALSKVCAMANKTKTTLVFINQIRQKIGVMFGNPETTTGGNALKYYASQRIEVRVASKKEKDGVQIGVTMKVKVVKNKVGIPSRSAEIDISFTNWFDKYSDLIEIGTQSGTIAKNGGYYTIPTKDGEKKAQGKEKTIDLIKEEGLYDYLKEKVVKSFIEKTTNALKADINGEGVEENSDLNTEE